MTLDPSKLPPPVRPKPKVKPRLVLKVPSSPAPKADPEIPESERPEADFLKAWQSSLEAKERRLEELEAELAQREAYIETRENFFSNRPHEPLAVKENF